MGKTTRAALYLRVSTEGQNTDGQESELREYAKNRGWEVTRIYRDKVSGTLPARFFHTDPFNARHVPSLRQCKSGPWLKAVLLPLV
jgi:hypothetical protein